MRDVLAHSVIDYHPVVPGTAAEVADHMQQWSAVVRGRRLRRLLLAIDVYRDGIDTFVDQVVPLLQQRGLFHLDYEGPTLRDHLDAPHQYGPDPRLTDRATPVSS